MKLGDESQIISFLIWTDMNIGEVNRVLILADMRIVWIEPVSHKAGVVKEIEQTLGENKLLLVKKTSRKVITKNIALHIHNSCNK